MNHSFTQPEESNQRKIYDTIVKASELVPFNVIFDVAINQIVASVPLSTTQKMAIKYVGAKMDKSIFALDETLQFVLFGDFQTVGLDEGVSEALSTEQRQGIIQVIYGVAVSTIQNAIASLQGMIGWEYSNPYWEEEAEAPIEGGN